MQRILLKVIIITAFITGINQQSFGKNVEQWSLYEVALTGPSSGNPFMEVELSAVFTSKGEEITVPDFYDGDGVYRILFPLPDREPGNLKPLATGKNY